MLKIASEKIECQVTEGFFFESKTRLGCSGNSNF